MPMTTDPQAAAAWLRDQPPGIEGVVAKRRDQRYRPGARSWQKLRARDTAEAVVGGCSAPSPTPKPSSSAATEATGCKCRPHEPAAPRRARPASVSAATAEPRAPLAAAAALQPLWPDLAPNDLAADLA
jgi:hypothetical protein